MSTTLKGTAGSPAYVGTDVLEVLEGAVNYNGFLVDCILARSPKTGLLLDFGAGTGTFAGRLQSEGRSVLCIEAEPKHLEKLKARGMTAQGSLVGIGEATIDYAYTLNVLEHIEDDAAVLAQLLRVLKPGAALMVYVPAFPVLFSAFDQRIGHLRRYTRASLRSVLERAGFRLDQISYQDSLGFFAALAYRLLGPKDGSMNATLAIWFDRFVFPISRVLDRICSPFFGKNVLAYAHRPLPRAS